MNVEPNTTGKDNGGITLTEEAYRRLEEMIVTLELEPGAVVSEAILSKRLGIGTTPIREALQRLAREFLVQILPRRGVVVTPIDANLQLQVLEVRREIDRLVARHAAERARDAERETLRELAAAMAVSAETGDLVEFLRLDRRLNRQLFASARNEVATSLVASLHGVSRRFWFHFRDVGVDTPQSILLHRDMALAVAEGDAGRAAEASDLLHDYLTDYARSTLGRA